MRVALDDDDADGRPAVYSEDYSAESRGERYDPVLERLIKVHKRLRFDLYWHPRSGECVKVIPRQNNEQCNDGRRWR